MSGEGRQTLPTHSNQKGYSEMSRTFERWLAQVEQILDKRLMTETKYLPDQDYHGMFEAGLSATECANVVVRESAVLIHW